jgi:hypothetical protein
LKIKYTKIEIGKGYTWLELWLMLPDFYTFWNKLGSGDREYLNLCWKERRWGKIEDFMEGYRLSLCRGCIRFGARGEAAKKKFSWTWFRNRIYGTWTELNTPYPKPKPKTDPRIKPIRDVPISRTQHFLTLLRIPTHIPTSELKDYVTLYILKRDYGKNFL